MPLDNKAVAKAKEGLPGIRRARRKKTNKGAFSGGRTVRPDDLDALFGPRQVLPGRPILSCIGIDVQGLPKTFKSTLAAGNPHAVIFKFPDGEPRIRRTRARVELIGSLAEFEDKRQKLLDYAKGEGPAGQYHTIVIDPVAQLWKMVAARELTEYNQTTQAKYEAATAPAPGQAQAPPFVPLRAIGDIPVYGTYGKIADQITGYFDPFQAMGWGRVFLTHYRWKPKFVDGHPRGSEWAPDFAPTTANVIAAITDMLVVCSKRVIDGQAERFIEFQHDSIQQIGARYPLTGVLQLSHYDNEKTPPDLTVWEELESIFEEAIDKMVADEESFSAATKGAFSAEP